MNQSEVFEYVLDLPAARVAEVLMVLDETQEAYEPLASYKDEYANLRESPPGLEG